MQSWELGLSRVLRPNDQRNHPELRHVCIAYITDCATSPMTSISFNPILLILLTLPFLPIQFSASSYPFPSFRSNYSYHSIFNQILLIFNSPAPFCKAILQILTSLSIPLSFNPILLILPSLRCLFLSSQFFSSFPILLLICRIYVDNGGSFWPTHRQTDTLRFTFQINKGTVSVS